MNDRVLQVLTPVFRKIDEGSEMDIGAFVTFMEELWGRLTLDQRGYLMSRERRNNEESQESLFMNPNSSKMAEQVRANVSGDIYERQVSAAKLTSMRLEKEKELRDIQAINECTFKPSINKRKARK